MSGLQLPGAFVLPSDPRSAKISAEKSVVKPGWQWFEIQIKKGTLRYNDKNRSSRRFRERSGLQLPRVLNRENSYSANYLLERVSSSLFCHG